jgi:hypothetical protein
MRRLAVAACLAGLSPLALADVLPTGTWVRREPLQNLHLTMTVEAAGSGLKVTYRIVGPGASVGLMTVLTQLDGKDAPVLVDGKPSGETMAVRKIDGRHTFTVLKMDGKEIGTSKLEVSADGKVLTVENTAPKPGGGPLEKTLEHWDKK